MKERPILFKSEMVRAILEGRKTQTRRILKMKISGFDDMASVHQDGGGNWVGWSDDAPDLAEFTKKAYPNGEGFPCPYGRIGDRLWVRETWWSVIEQTENPDSVCYRADGEMLYWFKEKGYKWRPSIFMPRWASRITLEIVNVRCERLQTITEADAIAEGIETDKIADNGYWKNYEFTTSHPRKSEVVTDEKHRILGYKDPRKSYASLWQSINGAGSWDANPFVWVVEFEQVTA